MKTIKKFILIFACLALTAGLCAQNISTLNFSERYVERFADNSLGMDYSQVWAIEEGMSGFIFAATNDGLAMFDGVRWRIYPTSNENALRALYYDKISGKLYSSGVNTFGYWTLGPTGDMKYTQLFHNTEEHSEDFWKICGRGNDKTLYFQTHSSLYKHSPGVFSLEKLNLPEAEIGYAFTVDNEIYVQVGETLYILQDDDTILPQANLSSRIVSMFRSNADLIVAVEHQGLFTLTSGELVPVNKALNNRLAAAKVNCCVSYMDGYLAGTTRGGFIIISPSWEEIDYSPEDRDLLSQTVLSIAVDSSTDIWLGFNSGIAKIDISSNEQFIIDKQFGQVEDVLSVRELTLVATNKGLFEATEPGGRFTLVEGSLGATWKVMNIGQRIYVLHDQGLFEYSEGRLRMVNPGGVINLAQMQLKKDLFIASHYGGLSLYRLDDDGLHRLGPVEGFNTYPGGLTIDRFDNLWFTVPGMGFQCVQLSADRMKVERSRKFNLSFGGQSSKKALCFTQINGDFILYGDNRAWDFDPVRDTIIVNEGVTNLLSVCGHNLMSVQQMDNRLWYLSQDDIGYLELISGSTVKHSGIFSQSRRGRITPRFFTIRDYVAVGFNDMIGYVKANGSGVNGVEIGKVEARGTNRTKLHNMGDKVFKVPYGMNNLCLYPVSISRGSMIDYRVSGIGGEWVTTKVGESLWISALPAGTHLIEIRPSGITDPDKTVSVKVEVSPPWYISTPAIILYMAVFLLVIIMLRSYYRRSNQIQQARLEARQKETLEREKLTRDKQIAELHKEQIKMELREKDKRLANITLNSIRRNNILNELKGDILEMQNAASQASVKHGAQKIVRKINTQLSDEDDWKKSESYFNTIYDGLLDRLREQYPALTKTDLKLCVYIKLNLTTKEMAELMNISPRSIEMARYRLRKKLNLSPSDPIEKVLRETTGNKESKN